MQSACNLPEISTFAISLPKDPPNRQQPTASVLIKSGSSSISHSENENEDGSPEKQYAHSKSIQDSVSSTNLQYSSSLDTSDWHQSIVNYKSQDKCQTASIFLAKLVARYVSESNYGRYLSSQAIYREPKNIKEYPPGTNKYFYATPKYLEELKKIEDQLNSVFTSPSIVNDEISDMFEKVKYVKPDQTDDVTTNEFKIHQHHINQNPELIGQTNTILFLGKYFGYPSELNILMMPLYCALCDSRLDSIKNAHNHYKTKSHDKHITAWLKENYTDKGLDPPKLKRFVTETPIETPRSYEYKCELCRLELTSSIHALQHFNGKRHRQIASKISPPTGIGYFDIEGKWVQTGKVFDKVTGEESTYIFVKTPTGFEPVVLYTAPTPQPATKKSAKKDEQSETEEPPAKKPHIEELAKSTISAAPEQETQCEVSDQQTVLQNTANIKESQPESNTNNQYQTMSLHTQVIQTQAPQEALESLQCQICEITATSKEQMLVHLKGSRHSKKLKVLGELPLSLMISPTTILQSLDTNNPLDISMYRTPSGSYYCKLCNLNCAMSRIKRHILGKKHLMAVKNQVVIHGSSKRKIQ